MSGPADVTDEPAVVVGHVQVSTFPKPPFSECAARYDADAVHIEVDGSEVFRAKRVAQRQRDDGVELRDLDSGTIHFWHAWLGRDWGRSGLPPERFHLEARPFPKDYVLKVRAGLGDVIDAALRTGHPVLLPDRYSYLA